MQRKIYIDTHPPRRRHARLWKNASNDSTRVLINLSTRHCLGNGPRSPAEQPSSRHISVWISYIGINEGERERGRGSIETRRKSKDTISGSRGKTRAHFYGASSRGIRDTRHRWLGRRRRERAEAAKGKRCKSYKDRELWQPERLIDVGFLTFFISFCAALCWK